MHKLLVIIFIIKLCAWFNVKTPALTLNNSQVFMIPCLNKWSKFRSFQVVWTCYLFLAIFLFFITNVVNKTLGSFASFSFFLSLSWCCSSLSLEVSSKSSEAITSHFPWFCHICSSKSTKSSNKKNLNLTFRKVSILVSFI